MKKRKLLLLGVVCAALYACSTDQTNESGKRVSALDVPLGTIPNGYPWQMLLL